MTRKFLQFFFVLLITADSAFAIRFLPSAHDIFEGTDPESSRYADAKALAKMAEFRSEFEKKFEVFKIKFKETKDLQQIAALGMSHPVAEPIYRWMEAQFDSAYDFNTRYIFVRALLANEEKTSDRVFSRFLGTTRGDALEAMTHAFIDEGRSFAAKILEKNGKRFVMALMLDMDETVGKEYSILRVLSAWSSHSAKVAAHTWAVYSRYLRSDQADVRMLAVNSSRGFRKYRPLELTHSLFEKLSDEPDAKVRRAILRELGGMDGLDYNIAQVLLQSIHDVEPEVVFEAFENIASSVWFADAVNAEIDRRKDGLKVIAGRYRGSSVLSAIDWDQFFERLTWLHKHASEAGILPFRLLEMTGRILNQVTFEHDGKKRFTNPWNPIAVPAGEVVSDQKIKRGLFSGLCALILGGDKK